MIRDWLTADNSAIAKIERESFSDPWTEDMLEQSFLSPAFRGFVEDEGGVKGYVGIICAGDAGCLNSDQIKETVFFQYYKIIQTLVCDRSVLIQRKRIWPDSCK